MATEQDPRHRNRNDETCVVDSNSCHMEPRQSDLNPSQTRIPPTPETQPGTISAEPSGSSAGKSRNQLRQQAVTGDDDNTTNERQSNSGSGPEEEDRVSSEPSDDDEGIHLCVVNHEEGSDDSLQSDMGPTLLPSSPPSSGDSISIANGSDGESGYTSGSDASLGAPMLDSYVDSQTLHKADNNCLHHPRILWSLCRIAGPLKDVPSLVEDLQKDLGTAARSELRKHVERTLPMLVQEKRWTDVASFLKVDHVRAEAVDCLDIMMMDLRNSQDSSVRDQLLMVATLSKDVMLDLGDKSPTLLPLLTLHLCTLSALVSRCPHPQPDQWSQLAVTKKQTKKKGGSSDSLKHTVLKALQTFHEGLDEALEEAGSLRDGTHWRLAQQTPLDKKKATVARASFCETIVSIFSLLNEVKHLEWDPRGETLLEILHQMYLDNSSASSSKPKTVDDCKGVLDYFLARQMALLLHTTFEKEKPQVGPQQHRHQERITDLLVSIARNASPPVRDSVLEEVKWLSFHEAEYVRQTFNCFCRTVASLSELAQGYLAKHLQVVGFRQHHPLSLLVPKNQTKVHENCSWKTFDCTIDQKPAEGVMYVPKASCLGGNQLDLCLRKHSGSDDKKPEEQERLREESHRHINNLDMLKSLSLRCPHLLKLYSYQILPFPMYVTEPVSRHRLLDLLLEHRKAQQWLSTCKLVRIAQQLVKLFTFLSESKIDPRGVTCYDIVVEPGSRSESGSHWFSSQKRRSVLMSGDFTIKLSALGLAHRYMDNGSEYNSVDIRPVDDQGSVPVRWLSWEALFRGQYGEENMRHNLGCQLYELWTHGAQPYSSYDTNMTTEEILMKMLSQPGSIALESRPCMPAEVYKLIRECTHHLPENRPSLDTVDRRLKQIQAMDVQDGREPGLQRALSLSKRYPEISQNQRDRNHIPERGLPKSIQKVLHAGKNSDLYRSSAKRISTMIISSRNAVTEEELVPSDWIRMTHRDSRTVVEEVVSTSFVHDVLPSLRASDLYGITGYNQSEDAAPKLTRQDGLTVHTREYAPCVTLETAARLSLLWDNPELPPVYDEDECDVGVLVPLTSLARILKELHEKGWMMRDLREQHILVDITNGEVILPRIGRMQQLSSTDSYLVDEVPLDSLRRAAPEVLVSGQYGKENDIFMFGRVVRQIFRIRTIAAENPRATRRHFAPCPNIAKEKLIDYTRDPSQEEEVLEGCPEWLHQLSVRCCHPDQEQRPTAAEVYSQLRQHCSPGPMSPPFIRDYPGAKLHGSEAAEEPEMPTVQLRRKKPSKRQPSQMRLGHIWRGMTSRLTRGITARLTRRRSTSGFRSRSIWKGIKKRLTRKKPAPQGRATQYGMAASMSTLLPDSDYDSWGYRDFDFDSTSSQNKGTVDDPLSEETLVKCLYPDTSPSYDLLNGTRRNVELSHDDVASPEADYDIVCKPVETNSPVSFRTGRAFEFLSSQKASTQQQKTLKAGAAAGFPVCQDSLGLRDQDDKQNSPRQGKWLSQQRTLPPFPSDASSPNNPSKQPRLPTGSGRFPVWHPICLPPAKDCSEQEQMWSAFYVPKCKISYDEICEDLYGNLGRENRTDPELNGEWNETYLNTLETVRNSEERNTESGSSTDCLPGQAQPSEITAPSAGLGSANYSTTESETLRQGLERAAESPPSQKTMSASRQQAENPFPHHSRELHKPCGEIPDTTNSGDESYPQQKCDTSFIYTNQTASSSSHLDDGSYARLRFTGRHHLQIGPKNAVSSGKRSQSVFSSQLYPLVERKEDQATKTDTSSFPQVSGGSLVIQRCHIKTDTTNRGMTSVPDEPPTRYPTAGERAKAAVSDACLVMVCKQDSEQILMPASSFGHLHLSQNLSDSDRQHSKPERGVTSSSDGQSETKSGTSAKDARQGTFNAQTDDTDNQRTAIFSKDAREGAYCVQPEYADDEGAVIPTEDADRDGFDVQPKYSNDEATGMLTGDEDHYDECVEEDEVNEIYDSEQDGYDIIEDSDVQCDHVHASLTSCASSSRCRSENVEEAFSGHSQDLPPAASLRFTTRPSSSVTAVARPTRTRRSRSAALVRSTPVARAPSAHQSVDAVTKMPCASQRVTDVTSTPSDHRFEVAVERKPTAQESVTAMNRPLIGHRSETAVTAIPVARHSVSGTQVAPRNVTSTSATPSVYPSVTSLYLTPIAPPGMIGASVKPNAPQGETSTSVTPDTHKGMTGVSVTPNTRQRANSASVTPDTHREVTRASVTPSTHRGATSASVTASTGQGANGTSRTPNTRQRATGAFVTPNAHRGATSASVTRSTRPGATSVSVTPTVRERVTSAPILPPTPHGVTLSMVNELYQLGGAGEGEDNPGVTYVNAHDDESYHFENSALIPVARSMENDDLARDNSVTELLPTAGANEFLFLESDTEYEGTEGASTENVEAEHPYLDLM